MRVCVGVELSMEDYSSSLGEVKEVRREKKEELLTKPELKLYRKYVGKKIGLGTEFVQKWFKSNKLNTDKVRLSLQS